MNDSKDTVAPDTDSGAQRYFAVLAILANVSEGMSELVSLVEDTDCRLWAASGFKVTAKGGGV
tara:strand:+ start:750 stop:938 length:189 start_codon:yes stop_codon:yes gene_type:complete